MKGWLLLLIAIAGEVIATSVLKSTQGFTRLLPTCVVFLGYGMSFYFLSLSLNTIAIGIAYSVWAGLGIVLVTLISWLVYGQKIDLWGFVGMACILAGVLILNLFSRASVH
ncbi:DMT family transporter [Pokkaliibacter sp. CJK22405]|uniref:DMT family transporter n=1 Tax=Pokkaliibacter sp. CJK22405 TaxID=3384615 RepID=UPI0039849265